MITRSLIDIAVAASRTNRRTAPILRNLIVTVVDEAAREHYGGGYSGRCLQASLAVRLLLAEFGIRCHLTIGAACSLAYSPATNSVHWVGYWGEGYHHIWVITQWGELVDLTMAEPGGPFSVDGEIRMPRLWWNDLGCWPPFLLYLPDVHGEPVVPSSRDHADNERFCRGVTDIMGSTLDHTDPGALRAHSLLEDLASFEKFVATDHAWARAMLSHGSDIALPKWMEVREAELVDALSSGFKAPSRLFGG